MAAFIKDFLAGLSGASEIVCGVSNIVEFGVESGDNMTTDERDTVLRMVDTYERLLIENSARKVVMKSLSPRPGEPTLEQQVATLIADVSADSEIHRHFEEFRAKIRSIAEDHSLIEMLKQLPPPK